MAKTIVYEISQLAKWPGMMTGIPRTMDELARRFQNDEAKFVDWDSDSKCFYEVSYEAAMQKQQELSHPSQTVATEVTLLRRLVRKAKAKSRLFEKAFNAIYVRLRHVSEQVIDPISPYQFSNDDIFFIAWGEAIDEEYTNAIIRAHDLGAHIIQIAHDMIPIITPQFAGHTTEALKRYAAAIFPISDVVLANSESTKHDVQKWLSENGLKMPRIEVIRLGDDFHFAKPKKVSDHKFAESGLKGKDYILIVGTVEARKNHTLLYYTYKLAKEKKVKLPKLLIVGRPGWMTSEVTSFIQEDPEVKDDIILLQDVSNEELSWLFENSLFSLYISFYEGWGLPIAESIARGIPCISSNTSSMPEVANGLASRYINPASTDECLEAIQALSNPKVLAIEREKIAKYKQFSWDETYQQVVGMIEGV